MSHPHIELPPAKERNEGIDAISRRALLRGAGVAITGTVIGASTACGNHVRATTTSAPLKPAGEEAEWAAVRDEFDASRDVIHMAGMLITSHPRTVRQA